jgi:hypothetical protein
MLSKKIYLRLWGAGLQNYIRNFWNKATSKIISSKIQSKW